MRLRGSVNPYCLFFQQIVRERFEREKKSWYSRNKRVRERERERERGGEGWRGRRGEGEREKRETDG
jgi:hypothetical protein